LSISWTPFSKEVLMGLARGPDCQMGQMSCLAYRIGQAPHLHNSADVLTAATFGPDLPPDQASWSAQLRQLKETRAAPCLRLAQRGSVALSVCLSARPPSAPPGRPLVGRRTRRVRRFLRFGSPVRRFSGVLTPATLSSSAAARDLPQSVVAALVLPLKAAKLEKRTQWLHGVVQRQPMQTENVGPVSEVRQGGQPEHLCCKKSTTTTRSPELGDVLMLITRTPQIMLKN
jgi:hypothetical protein